tara:strand:- start:332 stop:661 length:330 start_codon:yes stop_codon:yes gene_type:complete
MKEGLSEENTQIKANLGFMIKVIGFVGTAVWTYAAIDARITTLEMEVQRMSLEQALNSEFRIKWPRGELGSLPDDAEQNMRLNFMEKEMTTQAEQIDTLRIEQAKQIQN